MSQIFDPLNLVLAGVAIFVCWRLWSVLGQRTGNERPPADLTIGSSKSTPDPGNVLEFPKIKLEPENPFVTEPDKPVWEGFAKQESDLAIGLEKLAQSDSTFSPKGFLTGAKLAYEMIVDAFAKGDKGTLKNLLSRDVFDGFSKAIDARAKAGERMDFQFVGFEKADFLTVALVDMRATITLKFIGEMISATYDKAGNLVGGNPKEIQEVTDIWSFERDVGQKDPNWRVVATETQN
jgi:predicted lipid-binding transport protein (Tim44 family)